MFLLKFDNGTEAKGQDLTWDDVSGDLRISGAHLTLPFKAQAARADGTFQELPARTISLSGYNRYYYSKEAVAGVLSNGKMMTGTPDGAVVAEVLGGIDDRSGQVFQLRVAKDGNITTNHFPVSQLTVAEHAIRLGKPLKTE